MSDLIVKREEHVMGSGEAAYPVTWMVGLDARAAALETCGCEKSRANPPAKFIERLDMGRVLQVTFVHPGQGSCVMAFSCAKQSQESGDLTPLEFEALHPEMEPDGI